LRKSNVREFLINTLPLEGGKVRLRHKVYQDAVNEYLWRKDEELCRLDATKPITTTFDEFLKWNSHDVNFSDNSYVLGIETTDGKFIGNCGCFNIDESDQELELGILIGEKEYWNHGYGYDAILTLITSLFANTNLKRIYLKTLDWNLRAHKCFKKCGFRECDKMVQGDHLFLVMDLKRPVNTIDQEIKPKQRA
jgi:RimJ/RimL family protein N-acetyltransferase